MCVHLPSMQGPRVALSSVQGGIRLSRPHQKRSKLIYSQWNRLKVKVRMGFNLLFPKILGWIRRMFDQVLLRFFYWFAYPPQTNDSYITLIPKVDAPETMSNFKPIGLCNTIYKLITKIISSRIRPILSTIIIPLQSSLLKDGDWG